MAIRGLPRRSASKTGIDFNFGKEPANSFTQDQHPDLRADYVMANPPFNIKEWWDGKVESDRGSGHSKRFPKLLFQPLLAAA